MQAVILAAGMGKRLKHLTKTNTKCMISVCGETLIQRLLTQLDDYSLNKIIIVTGYQEDNLRSYISTLQISTPITFISNPEYETTNNIHSLFLASKYMETDDTVLFESDVIFDRSILDLLLNDPRHSLAVVDKFASWMDGTCCTLNTDDSIKEFVPKSAFDFGKINEYYKTVNIYKFSKEFSKNTYVPFLKAYVQALGNNEYYEQVLKVLTILDKIELRALRLTGQTWYEIDDAQDLDIANVLFSKTPEQKLKQMQDRYGGYWRFPRLLDFCYLVNPYFPPQKMIEEMKASFESLLRSYPSGLAVNTLLAGKQFDILVDNIVIGNGAAELIKTVLGLLDGKIGVIRPTFEEYPNRCNRGEIVEFVPKTDGFVYSADDLMDYFENSGIRNLVLINPDNPSGNYIPKAEVFRLAAWCEKKGIHLILDESFIDFADEPNGSLLRQDLLDTFPRLILIKSISKSYGVPGLRLGILASADRELISSVKKTVSIWNINSFAEYYLQIEEKYKAAYEGAIVQINRDRKELLEKLKKIPGLHPYPSQANYILVRLERISSTELTQDLLWKYDIFIKDLHQKIGEDYIRLAVRTHKDNDILIQALKECITNYNH